MEPYVGEIRMFAGRFAPAGWEFCNGQLVSISENSTLFSLIGTTYGGDGVNNFGLPDLRGRIAVHSGSGYPLGETGGVETVTLDVSQMPVHSHVPQANLSTADQKSPQNHFWGPNSANPYVHGAANGLMNISAVLSVGGSMPHDNMMPYVALSFIIAMAGVLPPHD